MGLISCANFVIAGVDGVIHQRDFTSVKINANITLITALVDVTYNTNQSWFVANILENKYNLPFLLAFFKMRDNMHSWDRQFSERMRSPRGGSKTVLLLWEWLRRKLHECEKKIILHIDIETTDSVLGIQTSQDTFVKAKVLHFCKEHPSGVPRGENNLTL